MFSRFRLGVGNRNPCTSALLKWGGGWVLPEFERRPRLETHSEREKEERRKKKFSAFLPSLLHFERANEAKGLFLKKGEEEEKGSSRVEGRKEKKSPL